MPLVDYGSDSDSGSDAEPCQRPPPPSKSVLSSSLSSLLPKPKSKLPVSGNAPVILAGAAGTTRKIIVQLPREESVGDCAEADGGEPPSKRARVDDAGGMGMGLGSGLASMLPAPRKSRGVSTGGDMATAGTERKERVLGGGAARKEDEDLVVMPGEMDVAIGPKFNTEQAKQSSEEENYKVPVPEEAQGGDRKISAPTTQFIPQSVSRKTIQPASSFRQKKGATVIGAARPRVSGCGGIAGASTSKPKVSLFGSASAALSSISTAPASTPTSKPSEYKPLLVTSAPTPVPESSTSPDTPLQYGPTEQQTDPSSATPDSNPASDLNSLESVAARIGLDESSMRQLLGRGNRFRDPVNIATFDVSTEYASNNVFARDEAARAAMAVNPVRSIAPGKHQLTQLLNAAQAQKGAFEERFAEGKRNRREAGGRYGW